MHLVILPSARQIGFQASRSAGRDTLWSDTIEGESPAVEPIEPAHQHSMRQNHGVRHERRSSEARANAQALHLGIAAQMWSTQPSHDAAIVLPLPPVARMAARYASTAQGVNQAASMGFARTA